MFKKVLSFLVTCVFLLSSGASFAADLSGALSSLGGAVASANAPGRFQSGARNVMTAGGVELRVPAATNNSQLFSFTPPKIEGGCGGISGFFGGFSFMSGKEFEQLLKNIASGAAMGFVSHLAMKVLCPYCESVAEFLQRINQAAAKSAQDSCKWGKQMAEGLTGKSGGTSNSFGFSAECAAISPKTGGAKDALDAEGSLCRTAFDAVAQLEKWVGSEKDSGGEGAAAAAQAQVSLGNGMWTATGRMFPSSETQPEMMVLRTWLMNLTGTTLVGTGTNVRCGDTPGGADATTGVPRLSCPGSGGGMLSADEVQNLMLCGSSPPNPAKDGHASITEFCREGNRMANHGGAGGTTQRKVMVCAPEGAGKVSTCAKIDMVPLESAKVGGIPLLAGTGLMYQVRDILGAAVSRVVKNEKIYAGPGDEVGAQIVRLMQIAPYPIYQVVNAAAVYPGGALDLIDTMSLLIGESLAYSYVDEYLRIAGRTDVGAVIDEVAIQRVNTALEGIRGKVKERKSLIVQNMTIQDTLNANIRQINQAIQRQVMTTDVMNGNKFTATVGGSVMGTNSGKGAEQANQP